MKQKLVGTYTIQDFPPASLEELHQNLAVPLLQAVNAGSPITSPASVPIANLCSMLHTLGLMHDRISTIYSLIYDAQLEELIKSHLSALNDVSIEDPSPITKMYAVIWEDYQKYKLARKEGEAKMAEQMKEFDKLTEDQHDV
jgi:hypothetical protein